MKAAFGVGFLFQNKVNTLFAGWAYLCDAVIGVNAYRRTYERTDGRTDGQMRTRQETKTKFSQHAELSA